MNLLHIPGSRLKYWELGKILLLTLGLGATWKTVEQISWNTDMTIGYIDPSIWLLILISIICFIALIALSSWIVLRLWSIVGLPSPCQIISQFNYLQPCQKLNFLFAAYALLLLAAVGCLMAIC
jgi:hypothetical protein